MITVKNNTTRPTEISKSLTTKSEPKSNHNFDSLVHQKTDNNNLNGNLKTSKCLSLMWTGQYY